MDSLPPDVIVLCFSYLGSEEAINFSKVSRHFRKELQNQSIWKNIANKEWPVSLRVWRSSHPSEIENWKELILYWRYLKKIWFENALKTKKISLEEQKGHSTAINSLCIHKQEQRTHVLSSSMDGQIIDWDLGRERWNLMRTNIILQTQNNVEVHYDSKNKRIIACTSEDIFFCDYKISESFRYSDEETLLRASILVYSSNKTRIVIVGSSIFICESEEIQFKSTKSDFYNTVGALEESRDDEGFPLIITGSDTGCLTIWNSQCQELTHVHFPTEGSVIAVSVCGKYFAAGFYSGKIMIFEYIPSQLKINIIFESLPTRERVTSIRLEDNMLCSGHKNFLCIFKKVNSNWIIHNVCDARGGSINCICFDDVKIVTCASDGLLKLFEVEHPSSSLRIDWFLNGVKEVKLDNEILVASRQSIFKKDTPDIPLTKLRQNISKTLPGKQKICLLSTGAFSPPHLKHLEMLEVAKNYLSKQNMEVVFGVFSPSHDSYQKLGLVQAHHRLEMCQAMVEDSDWLEVSSWEARNDFAMPIEVMRNLDKVINEGIETQDKIRIIYVCGADLLARIRDAIAPMLEYGIVVLGRAENPIEKSLEPLGIDVDSLLGKKLFTISNWEETDLSSTKIRKRILAKESIEGMVHPKVKEYIEKFHLFE